MHEYPFFTHIICDAAQRADLFREEVLIGVSVMPSKGKGLFRAEDESGQVGWFYGVAETDGLWAISGNMSKPRSAKERQRHNGN